MPPLRAPTLFWAAVALVLLGAPLRRAPAESEAAFRVRVTPLEGEPTTGALRELADDDLTIVSDAGDRTFPWGKIIEIRPEAALSSPLAGERHVRVHLTGGERLMGTFAGSLPDGLILDAPDLGRLPIRFDVVRTLVVVPAEAGPCYEPEARHPASEEDVAYLASGDAYRGLLVAADAGGFRIETERKQVREIPWADLSVLHLANDDVPPAEGLQIEIETLSGSRLLTAARPKLSDGTLAFPLRSDSAMRMALPLASVRTIRTRGGDFVYASDLPFASTFETPYGGGEGDEVEREFLEAWYAARVDRRPTGCPLRLGGEVVRHGFAVHARSVLTIDLKKSYRVFRARFGVDDEALEVPAGGIVDARVRGDGEVLWEAKAVKAGETPRVVGPLDVRGLEKLVLEVDFGEELHIRDRATWAEPVLIRLKDSR